MLVLKYERLFSGAIYANIRTYQLLRNLIHIGQLINCDAKDTDVQANYECNRPTKKVGLILFFVARFISKYIFSLFFQLVQCDRHTYLLTPALGMAVHL